MINNLKELTLNSVLHLLFIIITFTQGETLKRKEARHIVRMYMVTNNPTWGNMSPMTLIARQRGDIIGHDLCWAVVHRAWVKGYEFDEARYAAL